MKYMCPACGWIYDEEVGDPANDVMPGTPLENLPSWYDCQYCCADRATFVAFED